MANSYKRLKEDFVSGLAGGSIAEVNHVTAVAPAAVLLWAALQSRLDFFAPYGAAAAAVDFLLNCGAILLATTLYSSHPLLLNLLLVAPALLLLCLPPSKPRLKRAKPRPVAQDGTRANPPANLPRRPFLTTYRGCMMVVTCLAILAVDFRVFPRRFAKVETWGTSLMDMGVGSFVFSAGLVGARPVLRERAGKATSLTRRLLVSVRDSLPLLALGLVRLYSVKGLDYAEHVTEYGVHWNFFFTLALLPPSVALFQSFFFVIPSYGVLALLLGAAYQVALESTGLKAYVLVAPRTDLLSQNREGVFSFAGYLAIFLAGQATGMSVLPRAPRAPRAQRQKSGGLSRAKAFYASHSTALTLLFQSATWTALFYATRSPRYGAVPVSRRLANLSYVLWVAAFNTAQLLCFHLVHALALPVAPPSAEDERRWHDATTSPLLRAFNRNGLALFLLANLLTGAVNLGAHTLEAGKLEAMGLLVGYAGVLAAVALALDAWGVDVKM
ncbi:MAG: Glucosaminyl phosphatidylinositol (GlcN-PI) nositol acylation protein [Thelocarpon impressellum]|nr:MAG: Glucosaminyl phosphatidylinositol (GlcN-PI) nositol acylation protein [Thelocarpon impressellum]